MANGYRCTGKMGGTRDAEQCPKDARYWFKKPGWANWEPRCGHHSKLLPLCMGGGIREPISEYPPRA